jgi:ABC-type transport system substrate-binding protein
LFLSEEVSGDSNAWGGPNVSGYATPEFDGMALTALSTLDAASRQAFWGRAQVLFGHDVPALPLFGQVRVAAMRRNFTGFALDPSQESEMWNAEHFALG